MANFTLSIENCLIQVRARLQEEGIKLWLEPYYFEGIGAVDAELEVKKFRLFSSNCYEMNFFYHFAETGIDVRRNIKSSTCLLFSSCE